MGRLPKTKTEKTKDVTPETGLPPDFNSNPNPNLYRPTDDGAPGRTVKARVSFAITDDSLIDVASMRSENLARLKEMLRDPRNQAALGLAKANEPLILVTEAEVAQMYDTLAAIEITLAPFARIHPAAAKECLPFTDDEKKKLTPATQVVVSKHMPAFLLKWKDEIMLCGMLMAIERAKITAAKAMTKEIVKQILAEQEAAKQAAKGITQ